MAIMSLANMLVISHKWRWCRSILELLAILHHPKIFVLYLFFYFHVWQFELAITWFFILDYVGFASYCGPILDHYPVFAKFNVIDVWSYVSSSRLLVSYVVFQIMHCIFLLWGSSLSARFHGFLYSSLDDVRTYI